MADITVNVRVPFKKPDLPEVPVHPIPPDPEPIPDTDIKGIRLGLGICGPNTNEWVSSWNNVIWQAIDYMDAIHHIKVMSNTDNSILQQITGKGISLLTRLYHPTKDISAQNFVSEMAHKIQFLADLESEPVLQVWNEPNHDDGREGWFSPEGFAEWSRIVASEIKSTWPHIKLLYAPMVTAGASLNTWDFYEAGRNVIEDLYDGICVHCYWQNFQPDHQNHKQEEWGETYKPLHRMYSDKPLYITEAGNANNPDQGHPLDYNIVKLEFQEWLTEAYRFDKPWYKVIRSIAPFILWSPDPFWETYFWMDNTGNRRPMCDLMKI